MSRIQGVNLYQKRPFLSASNTGYAALTGMGLTIAASICKNKMCKKYHKPLGYTTASLTLLHLGVIMHNRSEWKKKNEETDALMYSAVPSKAENFLLSVYSANPNEEILKGEDNK